MAAKDKIHAMIERSRDVLLDACIENGAIVAANSDKEYFGNNVYFYRFVWPRDAAFTLVALDMLGVKDVHEKYYKWLLDRAEEFSQSGILYQNYHTHGPKHWMNLQPDSNGLTLWAIFHHARTTGTRPDKKLVKKLADGICSVWSGSRFRAETQDLWEERLAFPEYDEIHVYSAAMAYHGLLCADRLFTSSRWKKTAQQIKKAVLSSYDDNLGHFPRTSSSIISDTNYCVDASLTGLIFPAAIISSRDSRMVSTIKAIEKKLNRNGGIYRYEKDLYDGMIKNNKLLKKGAGAWPILNFWLSIYYSIKGDKKKAMKHYMWVIERVDDSLLIPEQVFENKLQQSISPLVWSHSMFIIASKHLGFL